MIQSRIRCSNQTLQYAIEKFIYIPVLVVDTPVMDPVTQPMRATPTVDVDELSEKAEAKQTEIEVLEQLQDEIKNCDRIGETILSGLFHEARTDSGNHWKKVTAFCNIKNGELVVDHTDKLSDGRWSPQTCKAYDVILSVNIKPFMTANQFRHAINPEIESAIRGRSSTVADIERQINRAQA